MGKQPTPYEFEVPFGFPTNLNIPEDNPMTVEGIELGRYLFYDERLAGRADEGKYMSCATCHKIENAFENGVGKGVGLDGDSTLHVMLPLINQVWNPGTYGWNGSVASLEDDVIAVMSHPAEFNSSPEKVVAAIENIEEYKVLFNLAFGTPEVTAERIAKAISQFIRTMVSANSRFDQYLRGELQLNQSELSGFVLFTTEEGADCFHCHGGSGNPLFTTHLFYNNGKDTILNDIADRYSITGDFMQKGAYKATTLRNIELTGPYMHDGRFQTLEEVINFYSHEVYLTPVTDPLMHHAWKGGTQLTPQEKLDLLAFLKALTDNSFVNNPEFQKPTTFPQ